MEYIIENQSILLLSGLLALIFVFMKDRWVSNQPVGNQNMKNFAQNISENANIKYISDKCIKQEYQKIFQKSNPVFPVLRNE